MKKMVVIALILFLTAAASCRVMKRELAVKVPETKEEQQTAETDADKYYSDGNYHDTISVLRALIKKEPENPKYWGRLGSAYAQLNEFDYSIHSYKQALKLNPKDTKTMYNLSVVYTERGSSAEAKKVLREALKLDPKNPLLQASLGNVFIDEQNYKPARRLYERIVEAKPDFDLGHFNLGVINYEERKLPEAKKNYENVLRINPDDQDARGNLAAINILQNDFAVAVENLKKIIASNPEDDTTLENAYFNLGIAYIRLGRLKEALAAFETAIQIEPWDMAAYVNAAILSEELGLNEKAIKYWRKYDRLLPVNKRKEEIKGRLSRLGVKQEEALPTPTATALPEQRDDKRKKDDKKKK